MPMALRPKAGRRPRPARATTATVAAPAVSATATAAPAPDADQAPAAFWTATSPASATPRDTFAQRRCLDVVGSGFELATGNHSAWARGRGGGGAGGGSGGAVTSSRSSPPRRRRRHRRRQPRGRRLGQQHGRRRGGGLHGRLPADAVGTDHEQRAGLTAGDPDAARLTGDGDGQA